MAMMQRNLARMLVFTVLAMACGAAVVALPSAPQAQAVAPSQVVGTYKVKLKGEGWLRSAEEPYRAERAGGRARLILSRASLDAQDPKLRVTIQLDPTLEGGLLDLVTTDPDFQGEGYLVGDSLTVIDTGGATYVNVLTLQFTKEGAKLSGHWISALPATSVNTATAGAAGLLVTGRRVVTRGRMPLSR